MAKQKISNVINFKPTTDVKSTSVCFRISGALDARMKDLRKRADAAGGKLDFSPVVRDALQRACEAAEAQLNLLH